MAATVRTIGPAELEVGQWIQFYTDEDLSNVPVKQKAIFQENQRYLVFSREDELSQACRCNVIAIDGNQSVYIPYPTSSGYARLVDDEEIRVVSRESVEALHGSEKVQAIYKAAKKFLEEEKDYFATCSWEVKLLQF